MSGQIELEPTGGCLTAKRFLSNASSSKTNRLSAYSTFSSAESSVMVIPDMHDLFQKFDPNDPRGIHASSLLVTRLEKGENTLEEDLFKNVCLTNVNDHSPPTYLIDAPSTIMNNHLAIENDILNQGLDTSFETSSSTDLSDLPSTLMQSSLGDLDSMPYTVSTPSVLVRNRYCNSPGTNHHHNSILGDSGIGDLSACDDDEEDDPNEVYYSLPHHQTHQEAKGGEDEEDCEADRVPSDVIQFVSESTRRITGRLSDVVSVGDSDMDDIVDHEARLASLCLPILQPPSIISSHNSDCLPPPSLSPEPLGSGGCGSDGLFPLSMKHISNDHTDDVFSKHGLMNDEATNLEPVGIVRSSPSSMSSVVNMSTSLSSVQGIMDRDILNESAVQHGLTLGSGLSLQKSSNSTLLPSIEDRRRCQTSKEPLTVYLVDDTAVPIVSRAIRVNAPAVNGITTQPPHIGGPSDAPILVDTLFQSSPSASLTCAPPSLSRALSASYSSDGRNAVETGLHLPAQTMEREATLLLASTTSMGLSAFTITPPPQASPLPVNMFTGPGVLLPPLAAAAHTVHSSSNGISNSAASAVGNGLVLLPGYSNYNCTNPMGRGVFPSAYGNSLSNEEFNAHQLLFTGSDSPHTGFYMKQGDCVPSDKLLRSASINSVSPTCSVDNSTVCNSTHILCTVPTTRINGCVPPISTQSTTSLLLQTLPPSVEDRNVEGNEGNSFLLLSPTALALSQSQQQQSAMPVGLSDHLDSRLSPYFSALPASQKHDMQQRMLAGTGVLAPPALVGDNSISLASLAPLLRGCQSSFPPGYTALTTATEAVSTDVTSNKMTNFSLAKNALPSGRACPPLNASQIISLLPSMVTTTTTAVSSQQPKKVFRSNGSQFLLTSQAKDSSDESTGGRHLLNLPVQILNSIPHLRPGMSIVFNIKNNAAQVSAGTTSATSPAANGSVITLPLRGSLQSTTGLPCSLATPMVTSQFDGSCKTVDNLTNAGVGCGTFILLPSSTGLLQLANQSFPMVSTGKPPVVTGNSLYHVTPAQTEPIISSSIAPAAPMVINASTAAGFNKTATNNAHTSVLRGGFAPVSNLLMPNATNSQCFGKISPPLGANLFENVNNTSSLVHNQPVSRTNPSSTVVSATNTTTTTMSSAPSSVTTTHLLLLRSISGSRQAIQVNANQQLPVLAAGNGPQQAMVPSISTSTGAITLLLTRSTDPHHHNQQQTQQTQQQQPLQQQPQPIVVKPELTSFLLLPTMLPSPQLSYSSTTGASAVVAGVASANSIISSGANSYLCMSPPNNTVGTAGVPWPSRAVGAVDNLFYSGLPSSHATSLVNSSSRAGLATTSSVDTLPSTSPLLSTVICPSAVPHAPTPTACQATQQPCSVSTFSLPITILPSGLNGLPPTTVLVASRWPAAIASTTPVAAMTTSLSASFASATAGCASSHSGTTFLPQCIISSVSTPPPVPPPYLPYEHTSLCSTSPASCTSSSMLPTPTVASAAVNLSTNTACSTSFVAASAGSAVSTSASSLCTLTSLLSPISGNSSRSLPNGVIVNNLLVDSSTATSTASAEVVAPFADGERMIAGSKRTVLPPADHLLTATCRAVAVPTPAPHCAGKPLETKYRRLTSSASFPVKRCDTEDTPSGAPPSVVTFSTDADASADDCLVSTPVGLGVDAAAAPPLLATATAGRRRHQCPYCPKSCERKDNLQAHIRTHTGERPYPCRFCSKAFPQKDHLRAHIRTHTGEKPYRCPQCFKAFAQLGNLHRHVKTHRR